MITIGGVQLEKYEGLPKNVRLLIGRITGGETYVRWAIQDTHGTLAATDDGNLLDILVQFLTGASLLYIPGIGLLAAPAALLQISDTEDLELLLDYHPEIQGKNVLVAKSINRILNTYRLRPQGALVVVVDFLQQLAIDRAPLFQFLGLNDSLRIYDLVNAAKTPVYLDLAIQREAGQFALLNADSVPNWVAWFQLYMDSSNTPGAKTPLDRAQRVQGFIDLLTVPCLSWIRCFHCPTLSFDLSDTDLVAAVRAIPRQGGELYFGSLASVMYHVVKHTPITPDSSDPATLVNDYGRAAQALIASTSVDITVTVAFDQGGLSRSIVFDSPTARAVVKILATGVVILATYFPKA